jgi:hypothetical protein
MLRCLKETAFFDNNPIRILLKRILKITSTKTKFNEHLSCNLGLNFLIKYPANKKSNYVYHKWCCSI